MNDVTDQLATAQEELAARLADVTQLGTAAGALCDEAADLHAQLQGAVRHDLDRYLDTLTALVAHEAARETGPRLPPPFALTALEQAVQTVLAAHDDPAAVAVLRDAWVVYTTATEGAQATGQGPWADARGLIADLTTRLTTVREKQEALAETAGAYALSVDAGLSALAAAYEAREQVREAQADAALAAMAQNAPRA